MSLIIQQKGCLEAGEEWLEGNLIYVATVAVTVAFMQVSTANDNLYSKQTI